MKKETKTVTRKSEFVKRGIVILLVCAMLLLLPGVSSFALSAAEFVREHSTKAAAPTDRGGLSGLHSSGETTEDEEWLLGEAPICTNRSDKGKDGQAVRLVRPMCSLDIWEFMILNYFNNFS